MLTKNYKVCRDLNELAAYINNSDAVAFDFETAPLDRYRDDSKSSLDAHRSDIVGISFSIKVGSAVYVPLRHRVGQNFTGQDKLWEYLRALFTSDSVVKIAHNLSFEAMFLYAKGIVVTEPCYDTFAAAQMTIKNGCQFMAPSDCGLKTLYPHMTHFADVTAGRFFDELDPDDDATVEYACADSDYALRLYHTCNDWFSREIPAHREVVERLESPTAVYCGVIKYNGVPIDVDALHSLKKSLTAEIGALNQRIDTFTNGINIGANASSAALKRFLFETLGLPVFSATDKGTPKLDDGAITDLKEYCINNSRQDVYDFLCDIEKLRKLSKTLSSYIDGYIEYTNPATGRIHPNMMPLGAATGRFSSSSPNLQNMPRTGNDPAGVRNLIKAPDSHKLLSVDFSQIELRVGAFYCRDKKMLGIYRKDGDIHTLTEQIIFGAEDSGDESKHTSEHRVIAKRCNFGVFYGLYPKGLMSALKYQAGLKDITLKKCDEIIKNLKAGYPGIVRWQGEVTLKARLDGFVETHAGRRRYLPDINSDDWSEQSHAERQALNTPIQGTAADIMKGAMARIVSGLGGREWLKPILQIHDELVFIVPDEHIDEAVRFIKECMEQKPYPDFDVPLRADAEVGQSFGALSAYEGGDGVD